jgi:hypothetical protein
MDDFLMVAEVAELLQLNQQTIRNFIDYAKLPASVLAGAYALSHRLRCTLRRWIHWQRPGAEQARWRRALYDRAVLGRRAASE